MENSIRQLKPIGLSKSALFLLIRGYILPKQEMKFGKYAWLINGILNGICYGLIWRPNIIFYILMFPLISFVIQRRRNLWIGIIFHYLLNLSFMIPMIRGIFS